MEQVLSVGPFLAVSLLWLFPYPLIATNRDQTPQMWIWEKGVTEQVRTPEIKTGSRIDVLVWQFIHGINMG